MHLTNLHSHTLYCDGKNSIEEMILSAINSNMQSIGISTHGPTPFFSDWNIQSINIKKYLDEINNSKEKYKGTIDVLIGMELDYIPNIGFSNQIKEIIPSLDYYIGSVHYLDKFNDGIMWTIDYTLDEILKGIEESFKGNKRLAVETYYDLISEMTYTYEPPIIGHLDLIKKNNINNILFDERDDWYLKAVESCLNVIKKTSSVVEINTGGIARRYTKEQYPSTIILKMIMDKNIPIIINSDAHNVDGITCKFEEMYKLIQRLGFNKISYLNKNGWEEQNIDFK